MERYGKRMFIQWSTFLIKMNSTWDPSGLGIPPIEKASLVVGAHQSEDTLCGHTDASDQILGFPGFVLNKCTTIFKTYQNHGFNMNVLTSMKPWASAEETQWLYPWSK